MLSLDSLVTDLIFQQSAAPVGWTKDISVTDSMMRLTGGGASTGGTKPFATVFAAGHALSGRVGGTGLSVAQMPTHRHGMFGGQGGGTNQAAQQGTGGGGDPLQYNVGAANSEATIYQSGPSGSGATHDHDAGTLSIDMDVLYTSSIVAVKD